MTTAKPQINLYNTLTRTKAPFEPMDVNNVRMYVCGPTVYDFAHIGNARPVIVFDVLFRLLRHVYGESHVTYVRNITDVDDKINARALRDFPDLPLNEAIRKVTEKTENQFLADVKALGTLPPTHQPRATENIIEMQTLISSLIDRNHAYNTNGEVLFRTRSMPDYGQLSGRNLEDNLAGARVAVEAHKEDPADFVLWKLSSETEPGWDSPWGRGRPGWHIECSAMSERYLGKTFDIHGGGLDLIFPHHENEIAQSRCAHGTHAMANVWMHNGFLQVEGQKMSKSLGNFVTINDVLTAGWDGRVARFLMLKTHYRRPIDWTRQALMEAGMELNKFIYLATVDIPPEQMEFSEPFWNAISDDLNVPGAIAALHTLHGDITADRGQDPLKTSLRQKQFQSGMSLLGLGDLRGYDFNRMIATVHYGQNLDQVEKETAEKVANRLEALNAKDFAKADAIRNELAEQGIALLDYKDENGQRATKWEVKR